MPTAALATAGRRSVSVPLEAVLPTGTKDLVFVNRGDGRFVPREVRWGSGADSLVEIVAGWKPGDEVVASRRFLLDSGVETSPQPFRDSCSRWGWA